MTNILFLDIDGVLNCELHYRETPKPDPTDTHDAFTDRQLSKERIQWLNELCQETDTAVVISSTWRSDGLAEVTRHLRRNGATFDIIDVTGYCKCRIRGVEIHQWLGENCFKLFGVHSHDFYRYAIIDDDSDMLLNQGPHFFKTDTYSGLTPNTVYRVKRFLTHKTF